MIAGSSVGCRKAETAPAPAYAGTAEVRELETLEDPDDLDRALAMLDENEAAFGALGFSLRRRAPAEADFAAGADAGEAAPIEDATAAPAASPSRDSAVVESKHRRARKDVGGAEAEASALDCGMLCDLTAATCELRTRICAMRDRHVGDPRFENACLRAKDDCAHAEEIAATSCACEGGP